MSEATHLPRIDVYTDGGCHPNPGPGGWGAVILRDGDEPHELSGGEPDATNNRMEMRAAIEALRALPEGVSVRLTTDSTYLKNGITSWITGWRARGWRTSGGDPVKNKDLWVELCEVLDQRDVSWRWTKGHAGNRWNERADALATAAIVRPVLPLDDRGAVHLFASVAWSRKQGAGGWAAVLRFGDSEKRLSGRIEAASANHMHVHSAVEGLGALTRQTRVHLYTTSDYLCDGATRWIAGWRRKEWRTEEGKPVAHRELWERLAELQESHEVQWHVVKRDGGPEVMTEVKMLARGEITG